MRYSPGPAWMCAANDEFAGQSKIAVQAPDPGDTCSSFQRMPPVDRASGKGAQSIASIWTYSSGMESFMGLLLAREGRRYAPGGRPTIGPTPNEPLIRPLEDGRHPLGRQDLDPVAVRVLDEGQSLHLPVVGPLHELHVQLLEAFAGDVHVRHHDADVA